MNKCAVLIAVLLCAGGCAREVVRHPVEPPTVEAMQAQRYVAVQPTLIQLDSGYRRKINSGTEFVDIGQIQQGRVLKPTNTSFTVEGANMHEAYPVIRDNRIVGFYLPVEKAFSPLSQIAVLSLQERKQ